MKTNVERTNKTTRRSILATISKGAPGAILFGMFPQFFTKNQKEEPSKELRFSHNPLSVKRNKRNNNV